jgi:hypothetical protein
MVRFILTRRLKASEATMCVLGLSHNVGFGMGAVPLPLRLTAGRDVRYRRNSGKLMLALSSSQFDPERSFKSRFGAVRGHPRIFQMARI